LHEVVRHNRTIDWVLENKPSWLEEPLSRELVYGTARHYFSLSAAVHQQLTKPLRAKDSDIECLLLVGAYQLRFTRIPTHAILNETVGVCARLKKPWAKGLVNAILRHLATERPVGGHTPEAFLEPTTDSAKEKPEGALLELPGWLAIRLAEQYPDQHALLTALADRAPMTLRVNTKRIAVRAYQEALEQARIEYVTTCLPEALSLVSPQPASSLPLWDAGAAAVQDLGAMLVGTIVVSAITQSANRPNHTHVHFLDACCAPGGKLFHVAERLGELGIEHEALGIDRSARRLDATRTIAARLGHQAPLLDADATDQSWWDGEPFQVILIDAPCSGSGTLRRNPDIKLILQASDIERHQETQLQLLSNLWCMLDSPGSLIYCTCSILQEENDQVIRTFIEHAPDDPHVMDLKLPTGIKTDFGWQLLPTDPLTDGFYMASLHKGPVDSNRITL
jgi:16S rRNA (cytosine967-C5)-methyltransferase